MAITNWPKEDRPREKLLLRGEKFLSDAELLAIFLRTGVRGKTALDIALELLNEFGSLKKLLMASRQQLLQKPGINEAKFAMLKAVAELGKRYREDKITLRQVLNNVPAAKRFFSSRLREFSHEVFAAAFLDTKHRLLAYEELFHGTLHEANVYPREVVKKALGHNAAKIIVAHNHPSGDPTPSQEDLDLTQYLQMSLELVEIQLVDHIVVGHTDAVSLMEKG